VVQRNGLDSGQRRLRRAVRRTQESREPGLPGALGGREHSTDRPKPPVERELADRRVPAQRLGRQLPRRREHRQGDRQIEPRALLTQLGGRKVDRDPPHRPLELGRRDPGANAFLRLLAGAIGEADDRERRHTELQVGLDLDAAGVEPYKRVRDGAGEHTSKLGASP
jgi:hypothetical protein